MEKPAIIMNEAAFKMLLEALTGKQSEPVVEALEVNNEPDINKFLDGYYEHKANEVKNPISAFTSRNLEEEYEALKAVMAGKGPMRLMDIFHGMVFLGVWERSKKKNASANLKVLMKYYPDIKKVDYGLYQIEEADNNE